MVCLKKGAEQPDVDAQTATSFSRRRLMKRMALASAVGVSGLILSSPISELGAIPSSNGVAPYVLVTPQGPTDGGDFGPNTPGTTTAGIQEAINSLRGTYGVVKIMGNLNLPANTSGITLYPGIGLEGEGPLAAFQEGTSIISVPDSVAVPAITVVVDPSNPSNQMFPYIGNLSISGDSSFGEQPGQHGIFVSNMNGTINDFFMSHVLIYMMAGNGLEISNGGKHYFFDSYVEDNAGAGVNIVEGFLQKISRCYIFGNQQQGINLDQSYTGSGYTEIDNCEIWNNRLDGIRSYPGGPYSYVQIANNRFHNNGAVTGYSNLFLWYVPGLSVLGNHFEDTRSPKITDFHINIADSRSAGTIHDNVFTSQARLGMIGWNIYGTSNIAARFNTGFNPVGLIAAPFYAGSNLMGIGIPSGEFGSISPIPSTNYTVSGGDIYLVSQGGSAVSISIQDNLGNSVVSGLSAIITPMFLPVGWVINWGPFTVTPSVNVFGI
jgi:hypothetical protein